MGRRASVSGAIRSARNSHRRELRHLCDDALISTASLLMPESQDAQSGFDRLLIRTAIDPGLCHRLLASPDSVFAEFDLTEEQQDLLRHPDHRLLPLMGAMLARQGEPEAAPPQASVSEPRIAVDAMSDGPPPLPHATPRTLPDVSLALTVVPCVR